MIQRQPEDRWRHSDWNIPEGCKLREQLERSEWIRKEWNLLERKDARIAAIVFGAFLLFLFVPICAQWLNIPLPDWIYIPE
jgi:hypothetical protein